MGDDVLVITAVVMTSLILLAVAWQSLKVWQLRIRSSRESEYRELADRSTAAATETAARLDEIAATLAELRTRITTIETMLKEVE